MRRYGPLEIVVGILMAALVVVVFAQVVIRYVTYQPLAWTEEMARLIFIWASMIGAAIAARRGTHFAVSIVVNMVPGRGGRMARFLFRIVESAFYLLLTVSGALITRVAHLQHSASMGFPMSLPYIVIPISGLLMFVFTLRRAVCELASGRSAA